MGKIHELPTSSSRLLTSSQIITSVYCVVKELVENAIDGCAKNVEVKLENYGLEKIEVKDNGSGIDKKDIHFVTKPHFTSKINSYSDLEKVNTYGFRGEALSALCSVADLVITTKSSEEVVGCITSFNHSGEVISTKPCPCDQGSTVSAQNLFKNIPVRRQYYRLEKNKKEDLRKIEELLIAYGCIAYDIRFALYHNKNFIWQKPSLSCTKDALIHILGNSVVDHLKYSEYLDEKKQRKFEIYLPSLEAPLTCGLSSSSRSITSVNKRPVRVKAIDKIIKEFYNKAIQNTGKTRYPICFIKFTIPLREVDVNVEPNKTIVMLHNSEEIYTQFSTMLKAFYDSNTAENNQNLLSAENIKLNQDPKLNASDFLDSLKAKCDEKFNQSKLSFIAESPVPSVKRVFDNNVHINNHSSQKTDNAMSKKDIVKIDHAKEPCKKKIKSTFHVSKDDIQHHLSSLKNFFSEDKKNSDNISLNNVPTVTIERTCPIQKSPSFEAQKLDGNIVSDKVDAFAIETNMCSDKSSHTTNNFTANRKRHLSDSSISKVEISEGILKQPATDNRETWSRGIHPSGGNFQPVKILQPKPATVSESSPKTSLEGMNGPKVSIPEKKNLSFERKLTAFDLFCRSNRLEVAVQNPDFNNQQIAQLLSEKWSHLSPEEKAVYKNMLNKNYKQEVKKKERLGKLVSQNLSQSQQEKSSSEVDQRKMKLKFKDKIVSFHAENVNEYYQRKNRERSPNIDLNIINNLAPGIWICAKKGKLYLLNTFRLQETIIYYRLLETFQFESEHLETPCRITANDVGDEGMEILMEISKIEMKNGRSNIEDNKIASNGFDIKIINGIENEITVELIGITNSIAFYGIPDLKELLMLIKSKGCLAKLSECRPGKVILYLQSEANRMSRHSPACQRVQDVEDLLNQNSVLNKYNECIHHKPFYNELWNFE